MSKGNECRDMVAGAKSVGGLDILVNNAGIQYVAPVEEFPVEKWDQILAINLSSAFHTQRLHCQFSCSKRRAGAASSTSLRRMD